MLIFETISGIRTSAVTSQVNVIITLYKPGVQSTLVNVSTRNVTCDNFIRLHTHIIVICFQSPVLKPLIFPVVMTLTCLLFSLTE